MRVFATVNCARLAELRRGVDHATIYSIKISPKRTFLAATSDKSTLHIFELANELRGRSVERSPSPAFSNSGSGGGASANSGSDSTSHKWGILGKIPLLPRVFSDAYSIASIQFEGGGPASRAGPHPGVPGGAPVHGIIGWLDEGKILVVGTGDDGRWEKFAIRTGQDGRKNCVRVGWKRYLGG